MSCIAINDIYVAVSKGMHIDCFDSSNHEIVRIPQSFKAQEHDTISDLVISLDSKHLAAVSSVSKNLTVFDLPLSNNFISFTLPRSASKIRFTSNHDHILVADKTGDVLLYDIKKSSENGTKLLGHLSLLLDILQTDDGKYIITSDRDEKVKVSCYPNTYNIKTYCLGHKEFVNHIEILPHNKHYLTSTSGDGSVKFWDYLNGRLLHTLDTNKDVKNSQLKEDFIRSMNEDGIEVNALPIVHTTTCQLDESSSLLVVALHSCNDLLVYKLYAENNKVSHELVETLTIDRFPAGIKLHKLLLYVYDDSDNMIQIFKILYQDLKINIKPDNVIKVFERDTESIENQDNSDTIKVLYKRKFDNVQEYQERKKQRLEKTVS